MAFSFWTFIRLPVLAWVSVTSLIVLGMGGYVTAHNSDFRGFDTSYGGLSVAVSVITLITVVPMLVIDFIRPEFFTSWIVVELGWLTFLWILWLATGADTSASNESNLFTNGCDFVNFFTGASNNTLNTVCHLWSAIQAFAYLNWIFLMAYTIALLVLGVFVRRNNGFGQIWTSTVRDLDYSGAGPSAGGISGEKTTDVPMGNVSPVTPAAPQSAV